MGAGTGPLTGQQVFRIVIDFRDDNDNSIFAFERDERYDQFVTRLNQALQKMKRPGDWQPITIGTRVPGGKILLRAPIDQNPTPQQVNCAIDEVLKFVRTQSNPGGKRRTATVPKDGCVGPARNETDPDPGPKGSGSDHCV